MYRLIKSQFCQSKDLNPRKSARLDANLLDHSQTHKNKSVRSLPDGDRAAVSSRRKASRSSYSRLRRGVSRLSGGRTAGRRFVIRSVDSRKGASCFRPAITSALAKSWVPEWSVREASQWKKPCRGSRACSFSSRRAAAELNASERSDASAGFATVWASSSSSVKVIADLIWFARNRSLPVTCPKSALM